MHFDQSVSQMQEQYDLLQMRLEDWCKIKKMHEMLLIAVVNIGSGENYSIKDLVEIFGVDYEFIPLRKGEAYETLANIDKAKQLLNWQPTIFLKDWLKGVL